jgi:pantoate--beta-alanine ligase
VLFRALEEARILIEHGERSAAFIQNLLAKRLQAEPGVTLDYAAVVDAENLQLRENLHGKLLLAVAARFGSTRLIDNMEVQVS